MTLVFETKVGRWLAVGLLAAGIASGRTSAGEIFTQVPEIAASDVDTGKPAGTATFDKGPSPSWIWGPDQDQAYFARIRFSGGTKAARLRFTCDNQSTVFINGKKVGVSDSWENAEDVDLQPHLRRGENELLAELKNQGGPAGFIATLALTRSDDSVEHFVTGSAWSVAESRDAQEWMPPRIVKKYGEQPWGDVLSSPTSGVERGLFHVPAGFRVERLFTVPKDQLGSWVNIAVDNKGRLLASDQGDKGLCRITPPPMGSTEPTRVEQLDVKISSAQGILYAFDSLYLSVNGGPGSGLYRVRDTNGDDQYDEVTKLKDIRGGGEHGPHALVLSPDGKAIFLACGNHTQPPFELERNAGPQTMGGVRAEPLSTTPKGQGNTSRVPTNWDEDLLLRRQWDAGGHAVGILAPGGWIAATDPEGKTWDLISSGYRNQYDIAFNADGELFAYDADMEWDVGSPWYRPTRVTHATSGSEFGWRSGTGKWPAYFADSLPSVVDIGPGSPVGVTFGYGAKFPAKYQRALFLCDWTFGTMYAIHLTPEGASYKGTKEEFLARTPLPLTDAIVGADGALYFTVGGRGTQSELYRVTYVGDESTAPVDAKNTVGAEQRSLRRKIESYHRRVENTADAVGFLVPLLSSPDRFIRYAARIALEHQPTAAWRDRALTAAEPHGVIEAVIGLARQGEATLQPALLAALARLRWDQLTETQRLGVLRAYQLTLIRLGAPSEVDREQLLARLDALFPADSDPTNRELCTLLVFLQSPTVARKALALFEQPDRPSASPMGLLLERNKGYGGPIAAMLANQPDHMKMHCAFALRELKAGWTMDLRKQYFAFFDHAQSWSGGASFKGFLRNIDREAFEGATEAERLAIEAAGARKPFKMPDLPKPQGPGQDWTVESVLNVAQSGLTKGRDFKNGAMMFAATRCVLCHRFAGDGGATGPDLTQLAGRFNPKDLTEAIVDPSKVISDQYRASILTTTNGKVYTGKIVGETAENVSILANPEESTSIVTIKKTDIEELRPSSTSMMPKDLLKPLNEREVLDLLAYLLSRGNDKDAMFRK